MATRVRDVMQPSVLSVSPETSLADVERLFVEESIGGAPVVDGQGRVVGVVTASDLLRAVNDERDEGQHEPAYFREDLEFSAPSSTGGPLDFQDRLEGLQVLDAMTPGVLAVAPDDPVSLAAGRLREHRVHRVLVVEDGRLEGILSSFDLVGLVEKADL